MDALDDPYPLASRCPDHGLVLGPTGSCVICRREAAGAHLRATESGAELVRDPRGSRSVARTAAAGLAMVMLLGGVAFARGRASAPAPESVRAGVPVEAALGAQAALPDVEEPHPALAAREPVDVAPSPPQHPPAQPPQQEHDYLNEAYAALDKRGLYDAPEPGHVASAAPTPHGTCTPIYRRFSYGYGGPSRGAGAYGGAANGGGPGHAGGGGRSLHAPR